MSEKKWRLLQDIQDAHRGNSTKLRAPKGGHVFLDVAFMAVNHALPTAGDGVQLVIEEARHELAASAEGKEAQHLQERFDGLQRQAQQARESVAAAEARKASPDVAADDPGLGAKLLAVDGEIAAAKVALGEALAAAEYVKKLLAVAKAKCRPVVDAALAAAAKRAWAANEARRLKALDALAEAAAPHLDEIAQTLDGYFVFADAVQVAAVAGGGIATSLTTIRQGAEKAALYPV